MKASTPEIITIPNPLLRASNKPLTKVDKKTLALLDQLRRNLIASKGVGIAAPQIGHNYQVFAANLNQVLPRHLLPQSTSKSKNSTAKKPDHIRFFINPTLIQTAPQREFTKEDGEYILEGCLSLPGLFAPVPRFPWVVLRFEEIDPQTQTLVTTQEKFTDFYARNIQHEFDHLQGILFTDYVRNSQIALYRGNSRNDKLVEVEDLSFLDAI